MTHYIFTICERGVFERDETWNLVTTEASEIPVDPQEPVVIYTDSTGVATVFRHRAPSPDAFMMMSATSSASVPDLKPIADCALDKDIVELGDRIVKTFARAYGWSVFERLQSFDSTDRKHHQAEICAKWTRDIAESQCCERQSVITSKELSDWLSRETLAGSSASDDFTDPRVDREQDAAVMGALSQDATFAFDVRLERPFTLEIGKLPVLRAVLRAQRFSGMDRDMEDLDKRAEEMVSRHDLYQRGHEPQRSGVVLSLVDRTAANSGT